MAIELPPQKREELIQRLREHLTHRDEICFAFLHGSFVDSVPFNDLDMALYLYPSVFDAYSPNDTFAYEMDLSTELTLTLHVPVDIKVLNEAPIGFQHAVFRFGKVLFARDDIVLSDHIERISREYLDFSHHLTAYLEALIQ
ncbi:MAG: nucleotidyltransferase domain-containing protein [Anaerolineales bacterium]